MKIAAVLVLSLFLSACTKARTDCLCYLPFLLSQTEAGGSKIPLGAAFNSYHAFHNPDETFQAEYQKVYKSEVSWLTDEWAMKMEEIWQAENTLDFVQGDKTVNFAAENNKKVRGHTLVWEYAVPQWLETGSYSNEKITEMVEDYIVSTVTHFKNLSPGTVISWDVINEPLEDDGTVRNEFFSIHMGGGSEYIKKALRKAHEADPDALLFINEYGIEMPGPKADGMYSLAQELIAEGVPLHGIGFQTHSSIDEEFVPSTELAEQLDRFIALGLKVQITELDVRINDDNTGRTDEKHAKQADLFREAAKVCISRYPDCSGLIMWGLTDRENYIENAEWVTQDYDWPFILDEDLQKKPAYYALKEVL